MKHFKQAFNFYLNSSLHVGFAVMAFSAISYIEMDMKLNYNLLWFNFFATVTAYNFIKYYGLAKWHHRSLTTALKAIQVVSAFAFIGMCYTGFYLKHVVWYVLLLLASIIFLYAFPFTLKLKKQSKNLRNVNGVKIYIVALVWAIATAYLPVCNAGVIYTDDLLIVIIQRFIYTFVLMLPFEIRDLQYDSFNLGTIPQLLGVTYSKVLGVLLLFITFIFDFFKDNLSENVVIIHLLVFLVTATGLLFSNKNQNDYYTSFWIESLPLFWCLLFLFL